MSIYFLRFNNLVKIGYSSNLPQRVASIIAGIPGKVDFLGHMPGDREVEAHLHERFASSRFSGEWFVESDDLKSVAQLMLIPEMPAPQVAPVFHRRADKDRAWEEMSVRFRHAAARLFPDHNHHDRKGELAKRLGWSPRRVKSLYEAQAGCTLRQIEVEQLEEMIFADLATPLPAHTTPAGE